MAPYRAPHCVWFSSHRWRQTQRVSCSVDGTPQSKRTNSMEGEPVLQVVCPQSSSSSRIYPIQSAGRGQSVHLQIPHRVSTGMSPCHNQQKCGVWISKIFALRKRNAWRHLPECYHQSKFTRPNERQRYWRTHFLHKVNFWWAIFPSDWENPLGFSAPGPSAHHGLFAHALLQNQPLLFRAGPTMLPIPEWELLAAAAAAFLKSILDCSAARGRDSLEKANKI